MRLSVFASLSSLVLVVSALPSGSRIARGDDDDQKRICPKLDVKGGGCIRCKLRLQSP